jgi:hypothetical protein
VSDDVRALRIPAKRGSGAPARGADARRGATRSESGQIRDANLIERYKRLAIPVRRALNLTDRVAFASALEAVRSLPQGDQSAGFVGFADAERAWSALQAELDSTVTFGGTKVARRRILAGFLDAAAFYDQLDRDRAYNAFIEEWGTAAEGLGGQLTEDAARVIVMLDTIAAAVLGEPEILPPPERPRRPCLIRALLKRIWALPAAVTARQSVFPCRTYRPCRGIFKALRKPELLKDQTYMAYGLHGVRFHHVERVVPCRGIFKKLFENLSSLKDQIYMALHGLHGETRGGLYPLKMFLTTNQTFAGRSPRRRMYHGNQYSP